MERLDAATNKQVGECGSKRGVARLWASLLPVAVLDGSHVNDLVNAINKSKNHKNVSIQDNGASVNRTSQHKLQQRDITHTPTHTPARLGSSLLLP